MTWWRKCRRLWMLAAGLVVYALLLLLSGDTTIQVPSVLDVSGCTVALSMFFPLIPPVLLTACLGSRLPAAELTGVRPVRRLDTLTAFLTVSAATLLGFVVSWAGGGVQVQAAGRNAAFLAGLALITRAFAPRAAALAPLLWILAVVMCGIHGADQPYHWTILPEPPRAWWAGLGAGLAFALGLALQFRAPRLRKTS